MYEQARTALLAWKQAIDAADDDSNWFTDYVDGVQKRWPEFVDHVERNVNAVGEAVGDYVEGVGERWDQLVGGEDRLEAAVDPDVDVDAITPEPIWRDTDEPLYRSDDRRPEEIFEDGLEPRSPENVDLESHVLHDRPSAFVATSTDEDLYRHPEYRDRDYRYTVQAPGGIDVGSTLPESRDHFPGENEIAFPGGVAPRYVQGAHVVNGDGTLGEWVPNPNYDPD